MILCSGCKATSPSGSRFCDACGAALQPACEACGYSNRPSSRFCGGCGRSLPHGAAVPAAPTDADAAPALPAPLAALLSSRFAREGERKQVTVLFTDVRNSTGLVQDLDPEHAMHRLEPVLQAMVKAVHHYGGTINHVRGDGIMAVFGAPLAFEDHAVRACLAARAMLDAVSRLGDAVADIRVGLNSGEVVVRSVGHDLSMEYDAIGPTTHLANRMEQLAAPGTAYITAHTARLAAGFIQANPLGPIDIRGLSRPVEVFELVGAAGQTRWQVRASAHNLSPFVGRDMEMHFLLDLLHRTSRHRGQIAAIAGEAGMGKSRLVHELLHSPAIRGIPVLRGAAMPHDQATPYRLVAAMLRAWLGIGDGDAPAAIDDKLVAALSKPGWSQAQHLAPLRVLLDLPVKDAEWALLDAVQRRRQTHGAIRSLALQAAAAKALVMVVEDLHWADVESQSVLEAIMDGIGTVPLLVVVTYRPEFQHHWARYSYYSLVQLRPLEHGASDRLLRSLLGDAADLDRLRGRVIEQTDGTPLFLEEMARTLVETGVLVSEPRQFRLTRSVADVEIPASVRIVLASRIDRLPTEERTLLQVASVIGRDVPVVLLRAVADIPADRLARQLLELRSLEFLHEAGGSAGAEYTFNHALTHAVAYDSMLKRHRRALHVQVMAAIEQNYAERLDEMTERLADHAIRGEVWDQAARYCCKAGQRANGRSAHGAAVVFFERALDALGRVPAGGNMAQEAIEICLGMRVALAASGDLGRVQCYLEEAEELARSISDERRLMPIVISRATILTNLGGLEDAVEAGLQGRALAQRLNDEACLVSSGFALGQAYWNKGEFGKAEDVLSGTLKIVAGHSLKRNFGTTGTASVLCQVSLSHTYSFTGRSKQAFARSREALDIATTTGRPYDLSYARAALGVAHLAVEDFGEAIRHLEEALGIARSCEVMLLIPHAARFLGRAYALTGQLEKAEALLSATVEQARSQSLMALHGWCVAALGLTRLLDGAPDVALILLGQTLEFAQRQGYRPLQVHALRLLGLAEAAKGADPAAGIKAEASFRNAVELAQAIGMRPELAYCHRGLAELQAGTGRHREARAQLAAAIEAYDFSSIASGAAQARAMLAALDSGSHPAPRSDHVHADRSVT